MKPFGLQAILDYRKQLEDIAHNRLLEAKKIEQTIKERLRAAKTALINSIEEVEQRQAEGIEILELIRYEERITSQKHNVAAITKNLSEKSELVRREQENLLIRSKERQIMERLKESQNMAWQAYLSKKEAAMLDEIATTRHESNSF